MRTGRAFELDDLTALFGLDLSEPDDKSDIAAIESILVRLRAVDRPMPARQPLEPGSAGAPPGPRPSS
jgi:hypothetical protein